jgi:hypothetical protein
VDGLEDELERHPVGQVPHQEPGAYTRPLLSST